MVSYISYQFKCRSCFKFIGIEEKCFNYLDSHRTVIEEIIGFKVPLIGNEKLSKICLSCVKFISDFSSVKAKLEVLHRGFIKFAAKMKQDPDGRFLKVNHSPKVKKITNPVEMREKLKCLPKKPLAKFNSQMQKVCRICNKVFSHRYTLSAHLKMVHMKIKDFICDLCSYATSTKCNLIRHIQRNHIPDFSKKVSCEICGSFVTKKYLTVHCREVHSEAGLDRPRLIFICCKKLFRTRHGAYRHCEIIHEGVKSYEKLKADSSTIEQFEKNNMIDS